MHLILLILYGSTEDVRNLMQPYWPHPRTEALVTENLNFTI